MMWNISSHSEAKYPAGGHQLCMVPSLLAEDAHKVKVGRAEWRDTFVPRHSSDPRRTIVSARFSLFRRGDDATHLRALNQPGER